VAVATAGAGCGGTSAGPAPAAKGGLGGAAAHTPAALRAQRADLLAVSRGLAQIETPVAREVAAARAAWPAIARGLPATVTPALLASILAASTRTTRIPTPAFVAKAGQMTGPAAALAGLLQSFESLAPPCWEHVGAAATAAAGGGRSTATTRRFQRANVALYIGCVYDAHYNLSSIGEGLRKGYVQLGGAAAFGAALGQARVDALARAYGPSGARLEPKPAP
jgi:hypothetical protein